MDNLPLRVRAWDTSLKKMHEPENIIGLDGNISLTAPSNLILLLCSGRRDMNEDLIYVGDIVKSGMTGASYIIRFGEYQTKNSHGIGFWKEAIETTDRNILSDSSHDRVMGDIYRNPELAGDKITEETEEL